MLTFLFPFTCGIFQNGHASLQIVIARIADVDFIFQKSRISYIFSFDVIRSSRRVCALYQFTETINSRTHTNYNRHFVKSIIRTAKDKLLHNRVSRISISPLCTAMCFVYHEIESVTFLLNGVLQSFPDSMFASILALGQITRLAKLLDIQEVYLAILQCLFVKRIFFDDFKTTQR